MTLVLAIETATPRCSVALGHEGGLLASFSVDRDRRHVEALVPAIAASARAAGVVLGDIEALAVDVGPGLFTGMRVGIATAQALGLALGLGVHPVCSLDVIAHPLRHAGRPVAAVIDARRGEVFRSLHRGAVALTAATCQTPAALAAELADLGPCLVVGDGAVRHRALFDEVAGAEVVAAMPTAEAALELALAAVAAGRAGLDPSEVQAQYLRAPDARANYAVLVGR
ncbi:MAG: tRNA (adenosine(37)-N6)-threonylcarbamoyltransferase complex dimerization subunit type 1 TsaB [Acidimicrobiales bacterium]